MKTLKVILLDVVSFVRKVAKVLACNRLYALPRVTNKQMLLKDRTILFRIGNRNFSFHIGSRSLKSADQECPWCYASEDNKAFTADRWKELETLRLTLARKTMENKSLAEANALLLMKSYGLSPRLNRLKSDRITAVVDTDGNPVDGNGRCDAIDRGEGASPRFVLNPDKKEDEVWDPEGNQHVRYYINDAHNWNKDS